MFGIFEQNAPSLGIVDYSVTQTTLDQVSPLRFSIHFELIFIHSNCAFKRSCTMFGAVSYLWKLPRLGYNTHARTHAHTHGGARAHVQASDLSHSYDLPSNKR